MRHNVTYNMTSSPHPRLYASDTQNTLIIFLSRHTEYTYTLPPDNTLPPDTQNTLIIFLSVIVVMKVQMIF